MTNTTVKVIECSTCELGCDCEARTRGCGHYGCWGLNKDTAECHDYERHAARTRAWWDAVK